MPPPAREPTAGALTARRGTSRRSIAHRVQNVRRARSRAVPVPRNAWIVQPESMQVLSPARLVQPVLRGTTRSGGRPRAQSALPRKLFVLRGQRSTWVRVAARKVAVRVVPLRHFPTFRALPLAQRAERPTVRRARRTPKRIVRVQVRAVLNAVCNSMSEQDSMCVQRAARRARVRI